MKRSRRGISKKNKPKDLKRVTKMNGDRIWITNGKTYKNLRDVPDVKEKE